MNKKLIFPPLIGTILIALAIIFFPSSLLVYRNLAIAIIFVVMLIPTVLFFNRGIKVQKEKDQKFLEFIRDLSEGVKSGTPITQTILNLKNRDYGALSPHIIKISNQVTMGIPLTGVLENFALETKSGLIQRSVNLISEANRSGGEIATILSSVVLSVNQTENIEKERRSAIFNLVVQGYIIFSIFIIIILILEFFLMPMVQGLGPTKDMNVEIEVGEDIDFAQPLFFLLITQSLFSGLVIGRIAEGKLLAGVKHSFILVSLALLLSTLANVIFG